MNARTLTQALRMRVMPGLLLTFKVATTIMSIVVFSIMLLNFVTYLKYDRTLNNVVGSRFLVIADDLLQTVSNGLDLGLSLKELQTTQAVIESVKKSDPQILSISVFVLETDGFGKILYNTRHAGIGGNAPLNWIETLKAHTGSKYWLLDEDDVGSVGVTLVNNFKEPIGGIVVRYDQRHLDEKTLFFAKHLTIYSLSAIFVCFIFVFFIVHLIFRVLGGSFRHMYESLESFILGEKKEPLEPSNEIEKEFASMMQSTTSLWKQLDDIEHMMSKDNNHEDQSSQAQ